MQNQGTGNQRHPSSSSNEITSRPELEAPGKEGTLGGNAPFNARAGIQSARKDGVLDSVDERAAEDPGIKDEEDTTGKPVSGGPAPSHPASRTA